MRNDAEIPDVVHVMLCLIISGFPVTLLPPVSPWKYAILPSLSATGSWFSGIRAQIYLKNSIPNDTQADQ